MLFLETLRSLRTDRIVPTQGSGLVGRPGTAVGKSPPTGSAGWPFCGRILVNRVFRVFCYNRSGELGGIC